MADFDSRQRREDISARAVGNGTGQDVFTPKEWSSLTAALRLSQRESEIVQALFDGASEKRIAEQLGISQHTVHTYMWRIYRKLHVRNRNELLVRVFAEFRSLP